MAKLTTKQRIYLFFIACIPVRLFLVFLAKKISIQYLPIMGYIAIIGGIGFMRQYMLNAGGAFGQKAWWNHIRPIHGVFYIAFGIMAILKNKNAYSVLLIDILVGSFMFIKHYFNEIFQ